MPSLARALRVTRSSVAALVGAGGKTTALAALARETSPSVAATTSHFGDWQTLFADRHVAWTDGGRDLPPDLDAAPIVLVTGGPDVQPHRLQGLPTARADAVIAWAQARSRPVFFEADGSRRRPLKAPADHEPPIPSRSSHVVVVAGLDGLGCPLDHDHVHRPERFSALTGLAPGADVTPEVLARLLCHPLGGRKHVPAGARFAVLLNQADTPERRALADDLAGRLLPEADAVLVCSLAPPAAGRDGHPAVHAVHERVAGIVLAAGSSSRLGRPKQLLDFGGRPFVRAVAETALAAGLAPVVVVTGHGADGVAAAVSGLSVTIVHNAGWAEGQASSIRAGLAAAGDRAGAAVFLLSDQPQVPAALVSRLAATHARTLDRFVAPAVNGLRATPVLFDRDTFPDLLALTGDAGGREVIARHAAADPAGAHALALVPWPDPRILLDVDTDADYRALIG